MQISIDDAMKQKPEAKGVNIKERTAKDHEDYEGLKRKQTKGSQEQPGPKRKGRMQRMD